MGNPHILSLPAVDAAAKSPAAVRILTVVDKAVLAEEAFPAEGFHVDRDPVPRLYLCDAASCFLHDPYHLMAHGDAGNSPGNGAVLDVKITGADAGQSDLYNGILRIL